MNADDIVRSLPTLSQHELENVRASLDFLTHGTMTGRIHSEKKEDSNVLYDTMVETMQHAGYAAPPLSVFRQGDGWRRFKQAMGQLDEWIEATFGNITKTERISVYNTISRILIRDLASKNVPITVGVMVRNLTRGPALFDCSFPGYAASGLAKAILGKSLA